MNDLLSVLLSNPHLGPQHFAQDGGARAPDMSQQDLLLQELAQNSGAFSFPPDLSQISAQQGLNPLLLAMLLGL